MKMHMPVKAMSQPPAPSPRVELPPSHRWQCVFCDQVALLMHKGTTYCRACYDSRNKQGQLIG